MARIVYYAAMSADGFIADRDGGVAWLDPFNSPELGYEQFLAGVGAVVLGRATFEQMLTFGPWPYEARPGVVVSSRSLPALPWGIRVVSATELPAAVRALQAAATGDVWIVGGGETARACLSAGLIEELEIYVVPRVLGAGVPLFGRSGAAPAADLTLIDTKTFGNGVVRVRWGVNS